MKELFSILLAVMLVAGLPLGCSPSVADVSPEEDSEAEKESKVEPKKEDPKSESDLKLSFMMWSPDTTKRFEDEATANYKQETGITVEPLYVPYDDYTSKLNTLLAAKTEPDLYALQEYYTLQYGTEGLTENLTPYFEAIGVNPGEAFFPGTAAIKGDACYGVGKDTAAMMLFYNKPLFEKYGVDLPPADPDQAWDWDTFVENAKKLTIDANGNNALNSDFDAADIVTYGALAPTWWLAILPTLYSAGGSIASKDGMQSALTTPETIDGITKINDLINTHHVAPGPAIQGGLPTSTVMMKAGQIGMYWSGVWEATTLNEAGAEFGVGALPKIKTSQTVSWTAHLVVSARSAHKQEIFDFLAWDINPETNPVVLNYGLTTNKDFLLNHPEKLYEVYGEENTQTFITVLNKSAVVPENITLKNFGKINDQYFVPTMDKVWYGETTPEEALKEIEAACEGLFEGSWVQ